MDGKKCETFRVRCSLSGHDCEICSLATLPQPDGAFISICTEKIVVWTPEKDGHGFREDSVIRCPHHVVQHSLCVVPPSDDHPSGLILIGTNEPSVLAYTVAPPHQPVYTLKEHSDTVCSLAAGRFGTVVSGSWDKTAKVWFNQKCKFTLTGHDGSVLSILLMPVGGYMLTGSADSTIKRWRAGKCEHTFEGHANWVRALCLLTPSEFLSSSNDGTVRRWNLSGDGCLQTYIGHTGSVLDLASLPDGKGFVSVGGDGKMMVWKDGARVEMTLSRQSSLSSVCVVRNGDVVVGANDNLIRVLTTDPECIAAGVSPTIPDAVPPETVSVEMEKTPADKTPTPDSSSINHQLTTRKALSGEYFPETSYIKFAIINKKGVFSKLRDFNYDASKVNQLNKAEMEHLELLTSGLEGEAPEGAFPALWKLLSWQKPDHLFPALDILRFTMLNKHVNTHMCTSSEDGKRFVDYVSSILSTASTTPPRNQYLVLRALCNTFHYTSGEQLLLSNYDRLESDFLNLKSESEPQLQIAQSSLLLNYVIAFCRANDSDGKMRCLSGAVTLSQSFTDSEAFFRLLVAIGTAVVDDRACYKLACTLDLQNFFNLCSCDDLEKVRCSTESITKRIANGLEVK